MKTHTEFTTDLNNLRTDLNTMTFRVEKTQELLSDLVDKLDGLYDHSVSAKDQAVDLVRDVDAIKPKKEHRIQAQHFRFLALLNEYGEMPRSHVAKLLGLKESSVDQLANQIRKHHLGDLRSRKGVYILHAIGDDVAGNDNFKLV